MPMMTLYCRTLPSHGGAAKLKHKVDFLQQNCQFHVSCAFHKASSLRFSGSSNLQVATEKAKWKREYVPLLPYSMAGKNAQGNRGKISAPAEHSHADSQNILVKRSGFPWGESPREAIKRATHDAKCRPPPQSKRPGKEIIGQLLERPPEVCIGRCFGVVDMVETLRVQGQSVSLAGVCRIIYLPLHTGHIRLLALCWCASTSQTCPAHRVRHSRAWRKKFN